MSTLSISDTNNDADIDAYMVEQGQASGEASVVSDLRTPQISVHASVPPSPSVAQYTPAQKLERIRNLVKASMKVRETWYLVSKRWYDRWERACAGVVSKEGAIAEKDLGPVDNTPLVDLQGDIVTTFVAQDDAEFVPEEGWNLLVSWCVQHFSVSYARLDLQLCVPSVSS